MFDSEIEIKLTNSAVLLHYNNKEMDLFPNYVLKDKEPNDKYERLPNKKSSHIKNLLLTEKSYTKNLQYFEKYAKIYFNDKYSNDENFYNIKVINDIISNEPTHVVAEFKDYLIYGDDSEFLHDIYDIYDSKKYLPKLLDYYLKCSVIFPNYAVFPENKYIFKNIQRKQKLIDIQLEQDKKKEQIIKGEIEIEDNDDLFTTKNIYTILNQTNTSYIKKIFGINKKSIIKGNDDDEKKNNDLSMKKLIELIKKEENKNKEKKKIMTKIIKKKQILNINKDFKLKFKSKIINNIHLKINIKGRNNKIKEDISNFNNKNKNIFYTNNNIKNNTIKKINKKFHSKPKSKTNIIKLNNYINYKNSNINKIKNKNYFYSLITDSKANHILINKNSKGKNTLRTKSNIYINNNIKSNNNSSGKSKKTIQEYFRRKSSPKAIIIKMILDHNNKKNIKSQNISKKNKKDIDNYIIKKSPASLTLSLTNMKMVSHKTKKIYNRNTIKKNNSNSILKIKSKNKILNNQKQKTDKKFKSIIMKEINNSNSNHNADLINTNNNINSNKTNNKINDTNPIINNYYKGKELPMNLYKVSSFTNIQKVKEMKKNSKIKSNKQNSTLTGTTTCSFMKHSSIYYDKKNSKSINKKYNFYKNGILTKEHNNKRIIKRKYHNIITRHFTNNSNSNINSYTNKANNKTETIYFSKNILSPSSSIGYITNKKPLYEKQKNIKKYSGILPSKKACCNLKFNGSPFSSRMSHDTSRTKIIKNSINNDKIYSIYDIKKKINLKNINNSCNLKSEKNIKSQKNNSNINKKAYLATYYGCFKPKK